MPLFFRAIRCQKLDKSRHTWRLLKLSLWLPLSLPPLDCYGHHGRDVSYIGFFILWIHLKVFFMIVNCDWFRPGEAMPADGDYPTGREINFEMQVIIPIMALMMMFRRGGWGGGGEVIIGRRGAPGRPHLWWAEAGIQVHHRHVWPS